MPVVDLYGPRAAEGGCGPGVAGTGVWEGASVWAKTKFRSTAPIIATVTMKLKQRRECCIAFSPAFGTKSIGATQLSRLAHIPYRRSDKQRARIELEFLQSRSLSLAAAARSHARHPQLGHLLQQPQHQIFQVGVRKAVKIGRRRHSQNESDSRPLGNRIIIPPRLLPLLPGAPERRIGPHQ